MEISGLRFDLHDNRVNLPHHILGTADLIECNFIDNRRTVGRRACGNPIPEPALRTYSQTDIGVAFPIHGSDVRGPNRGRLLHDKDLVTSDLPRRNTLEYPNHIPRVPYRIAAISSNIALLSSAPHFRQKS